MDRIDRIMEDLRKHDMLREAPMPGPCGRSYYGCTPQYPEGYEPKKEDDKCTGCTLKPNYKGA